MFDSHGFLEKLRYLEPFTEIQKAFNENIVFAEEFICICISSIKNLMEMNNKTLSSFCSSSKCVSKCMHIQ